MLGPDHRAACPLTCHDQLSTRRYGVRRQSIEPIAAIHCQRSVWRRGRASCTRAACIRDKVEGTPSVDPRRWNNMLATQPTGPAVHLTPPAPALPAARCSGWGPGPVRALGGPVVGAGGHRHVRRHAALQAAQGWGGALSALPHRQRVCVQFFSVLTCRRFDSWTRRVAHGLHPAVTRCALLWTPSTQVCLASSREQQPSSGIESNTAVASRPVPAVASRPDSN